LDGQPEPHSSKLSFGVSSSDVPALTWLTGKVARLLDMNGQEVARVRIEKVDPELAILVATPLPQTASPPLNAFAVDRVSTDRRSGQSHST
jgi:hypothetical protein